MKKLILAAILALAPLTALAQPGPGPAPSPWVVNGPQISYSQGCVTIPVTVTGGCKGAGTINVGGFFVNGAAVGGSVASVFGRAGAVTAQSGDYGVAQVTGAAPLASPTFTGTVTVPNGAALGAPASLTLTSAVGLPVSTGISGLGTGVAAALAAAVSGSGSICLSTGSACSGGSGNATFGTTSGNVADDFVSMSNTTTGIKDSGLSSASFAANGTGAVITTSQSPTATEFNQNCKLLTVNATTLTITLPLSTTLQANGGCYWVSNPSAFSVSIAPNAADSINGGSVNTPVTFPANQSAPVTTDGAGHMFVPIPTSGGGTPCTSVALSLQYNNAGSFGCVTGATFSGGTLQLPGFTATGSIDLSGAANRNINLNATSEIDVGGATRLSFSGGSIFWSQFFGSSVTGGPGVSATAGSASQPTIFPNWAQAGTTGLWASSSNVLYLIANAANPVQVASTGMAMQSGVFTLKGFTVATLPASPATGSEAYVTDANAACTYGGTATGGGSTVCKMFYNGAWKEN